MANVELFDHPMILMHVEKNMNTYICVLDALGFYFLLLYTYVHLKLSWFFVWVCLDLHNEKIFVSFEIIILLKTSSPL